MLLIVKDGGMRLGLGPSCETGDSFRAYSEHCRQPNSVLMELMRLVGGVA